MLTEQEEYYLQDIKKYMNDISVIKEEFNDHFIFIFRDSSKGEIIFENGKYWINELYQLHPYSNLFHDFKFYLKSIITYNDLKKFIYDLNKYYIKGRI